MADAGFVRFPPTLNPTAQEFRPTFPYTTTAVSPFIPHPTYYSYPPPPPMESYLIPAQHPILPRPSPIPTRALLLSSVPSDVSESTVRRELQVFGDVRAVQMERLSRDGILTVHFYDLRQAIAALNEIQDQHMQQQCRLRKHFERLMFLSPRPNNNINIPPPPFPPPARGLLSGRAIWAQFTYPVAASTLPDGYNQGAVVVLDADHVSASVLRDIFEAFGGVKETLLLVKKKQEKQKVVVVEFYDTRDAVKAVAAVNGEQINGKRVVVEFSRPGGGSHKLINKSSNVVVVPPPSLPVKAPPPPSYRKDKVVECGGNGNGGREGNFVNSKKNNGKWHEEQQAAGGRWVENKAWKGDRSRYKNDPRFLIKQDAAIIISSFLDSRTTVMIKNIPNKYSQKLLLNMLDNHCIHCNDQKNQPLSAYDFLYLPIDFVNKCNVGYGFVNMTSPEATWRLYKSFHHQNWEVFNSKKICEVSYARLQGLEALKEHFKNSKFPREAEDYMPVVFTPPRDGRTLTEPMAIVRRSSNVTSSSSSSSMSSEVDRDRDRGGDDVTCSFVVVKISPPSLEPSVKGGDGDANV